MRIMSFPSGYSGFDFAIRKDDHNSRNGDDFGEDEDNGVIGGRIIDDVVDQVCDRIT